MDFGNSRSTQSSCGDEEHDSRCTTESVPSFLSPSVHYFGSLTNRNRLFPHHHISPDYLYSLSQSQATTNLISLQIPEAVHPPSPGLTSGNSSTCTDPEIPRLASLPSTLSAATGYQSFLSSQNELSCIGSVPSDSNRDDTVRVSAPVGVVRNSKKRTRASRRAPTTVLTTDTANFRAMVQEFTGIPAPPFSSSSYSHHLDLLTTSSSSLICSNGNSYLETPASYYPLRPSTQTLQQYPFVSPISSSTLLHSNMVDAIASTTTIATSTSNNATAPLINYQFSTDRLDLLNSLPHHSLSLQSRPILAFPPPPGFHASGNSLPDHYGAKSQQELSAPSLEELGLIHGLLNADALHDGSIDCFQGKQEQLKTNHDRIAYGHSQMDGDCKLNYSASLFSSNAIGEGTVDS